MAHSNRHMYAMIRRDRGVRRRFQEGGFGTSKSHRQGIAVELQSPCCSELGYLPFSLRQMNGQDKESIREEKTGSIGVESLLFNGVSGSGIFRWDITVDTLDEFFLFAGCN